VSLTRVIVLYSGSSTSGEAVPEAVLVLGCV